MIRTVFVLVLTYQLLDIVNGENQKHKQLHENGSPKILIVGAGMAGVSAAKRLHELGYQNFLIIEGSDRIGGRMKETLVGDNVVEMGALWIQSLGNNPIYQMALKLNLTTVKPDYEDFTVLDENGNDITADSYPIFDRYDIMKADVDKQREEMNRFRKNDASVRAGFIMSGWLPKTPLENVIEYFDHDFEQAIPPEFTSMKYGFDYTYAVHNNSEDVVVLDKRGYSYLVHTLKNEFSQENDTRIHLNQVVTDISHNDTHVTVLTADNNVYTGDYVIITTSLGVLQNNLINFRPELPLWKKESIDQFQMGVYYHPYLQFSEVFWNDAEYVLYASSRRGYFPFWYNIDKYIPGSKILSFTVLDEEARRLDRMTDNEIKDEALNVLRKMYPNKTIPEPVRFVMPRWLSDPLYMGSYSAWPVGYSNKTHQGICAPVDRFYFAGEACTFHHFAYVQGAFYSGIKTANDLVACITERENCQNYKPNYELRGCTYSKANNFDPSAIEDDGSCNFPAFPSSSCSLSNQINIFVSLFFITIMYFCNI